ncbi:hypothetical protein LB505_009785 [Fusarium chuoi]|nr:hypothetical protein LB505_009785 [Fusarium chuoi]
MHNFLKQVAGRLDLDLPPLRSFPGSAEGPKDESPSLSNKGHHVPSRDNSPKLMPEDDDVPYAPIHSLYTLTKLRALRHGRCDNKTSHIISRRRATFQLLQEAS